MEEENQRVRTVLPVSVLTAAAGRADVELLECIVTPISEGTGAATAAVARLTGRLRAGASELPFAIIRKQFRPLPGGRHAAGAGDPRHWAYWRREPLAYAAGLLPSGPGLAAPRCYGVVDEVVYLAEVAGPAESPTVAARRLGAWQAATAVPDVPWLAGHQLAQRIAVSWLDWSAVRAPDTDGLRVLWDRRQELLGALDPVPVVVCHGDFHVGNLIAGDQVTTVLDWGTLGVGPVGADLAHLALSTLKDPLDAYLAGLGGRFDPGLVRLGYQVTLALTAASRVHWMLTRGMPVPPGYVDFATTRPGRLGC
jgi:Phosphotransferase enzyme family